MKRRILSIDFDYFIDTDINTRNDKFPDGVDEIPEDDLDKLWTQFYIRFPEVQDLKIDMETFKICHNNLSCLRFGKVLIADSHKEIAKIFPLISAEDELEVINIDFHHDNYISSGSKIDCANWLRHLKELKPNTQVEWIRREDSELESLEGRFPYHHTKDLVIEGEFDYIFLCFSPEWTPPHLRPYFNDLVTAVKHLEHM